MFSAGIDGRLNALMDNYFINQSAKCWSLIFFFQQIQKITNLCQIFVLLNWSGLIKMPLWIHPLQVPFLELELELWLWSVDTEVPLVSITWSCRQARAQRKWQKRELAEFCCSQEFSKYLKWGRKHPNRSMLSLLLKGSQMNNLLQGKVHR